MFSCEFFKIYRTFFFTEHLWVTDSVHKSLPLQFMKCMVDICFWKISDMYEVYIEDSYVFHASFISFPSSDIKVTIIQLTSTCSKLIIETLEKGRKYVQS